MGKFKEFVPVVGALIIVALCALIPLGVGLGDDGLSGVGAGPAPPATPHNDGQSLQGVAQQQQQQLTESIVAASKDGKTPKEIAKAVFQTGAGTLVQAEVQALQGVQQIIQQAKAADVPPVPAKP
jgi:hypothetical protein